LFRAPKVDVARVESVLAQLGTIGDMFGAINALFSGLAIIGLIYTLIIQHDESEDSAEQFLLGGVLHSVGVIASNYSTLGTSGQITKPNIEQRVKLSEALQLRDIDSIVRLISMMQHRDIADAFNDCLLAYTIASFQLLDEIDSQKGASSRTLWPIGKLQGDASSVGTADSPGPSNAT